MVRDDDNSSRFTRRTLILGAVGAAGFAGIASRLYQLQILEAAKYRGLSEENQFNFRLLVPSRGQILDRNGRVFAANVENYRLLLMPDQVKDLEAVLARLGELVALSPARKAAIRKKFAKHDPFAPVQVIDNMDWPTFAKVNLWLPDLPGLQTDVGEVRQYPDGANAAHIIGYVGRVPPEQAKGAAPLLRHPGFRIGRTGIEKKYDLQLRGTAGALKYEVNALGRVVRELPDIQTRASSGETLRLTLDKELQASALKALDGTSGAACLLDLENGQVRVLTSTPSYDPNKFARGISGADYKALLDDEFKPLFNKAMSGAYPPASCFKPVVAMAAFDAGLADPDERIRCTGKIKLGDREFHCWRRRGHGLINLNTALGVSCDIYFYELAKRLGIDRLHDAAIKFGFGRLFDLGLGTGSKGLVPNQAWKRARFDLPWSQGETLIAGIGQGYLAATPLQLAVMTGRMATGRMIEPSLVLPEQETTALAEPLAFSPAALQIARNGMSAVVNQPWGTAYVARGLDGKNMQWAGKSGTGQVRRISRAERDDRVRRNEELPWKLRDHALFVGYAPFEKPKFAVSVVVEHGGGGSKVAGPKARKILQSALAQTELASASGTMGAKLP
ncbi:Peptidoglycan D,D-transpeptidase MrdA [hydrothermal vent metagenome]|uniref:Peptidoglycan D,D-transpeptidase MrdA n=1 Tax=hydrothermal vent metagenome TaxID=652676 RepID=A0A3B0SBG6_9ZZZZ